MLFAALTPWKRNVLIRLSSFFACAAAIPALMAVRFDNSETYGIMYGCFGAGSLLGVLVIARLGYRRLNNRLNGGLLVSAACIMLFGLVDRPLLAGPLLACIGASWLFCMNSIMVAAQMQLEPAIRGARPVVHLHAGDRQPGRRRADLGARWLAPSAPPRR